MYFNQNIDAGRSFYNDDLFFDDIEENDMIEIFGGQMEGPKADSPMEPDSQPDSPRVTPKAGIFDITILQQKYSKLESLYERRGHYIDQLKCEHGEREDELSRQLREAKHRLIMAEGDLEGAMSTLRGLQRKYDSLLEGSRGAEEDLEKAREEVSELRRENAQLEESLSGSHENVRMLNEEIVHLTTNDAIAKIQQRHAEMTCQIKQQFQSEIDCLEERNAQYLAQIGAQDSRLAALREEFDLYRRDNLSTVNTLVKQLEREDDVSTVRKENLALRRFNDDLQKELAGLMEELNSRECADESRGGSVEAERLRGQVEDQRRALCDMSEELEVTREACALLSEETTVCPKCLDGERIDQMRSSYSQALTNIKSEVVRYVGDMERKFKNSFGGV